MRWKLAFSFDISLKNGSEVRENTSDFLKRSTCKCKVPRICFIFVCQMGLVFGTIVLEKVPSYLPASFVAYLEKRKFWWAQKHKISASFIPELIKSFLRLMLYSFRILEAQFLPWSFLRWGWNDICISNNHQRHSSL